MAGDVTSAPLLDRRALNRATLARQWLLERHEATPEAAIAQLVGLQAQEPPAPYVGLWSRLADPAPRTVSALLESGRLARLTLMRATVHLVTTADALALRPLVQPVIDRSLRGSWGGRLVGVQREELVAAARPLLDEAPRTAPELGTALRARFPDRDAEALGMAARTWLTLVQLPPRGLWQRSGRPVYATLERWARDTAPAAPFALEDLVLRYLAAFGPATARDVQMWSGIPRLGPVLEALRPQLAAFRDEHGVALLDLPDAPRPPGDTPAPPRFLPPFDNLLLSHHDRVRVIADDDRARVGGTGAVLVDGFVHATWHVRRQRAAAVLAIALLRPLPARRRAAVVREGARLLAFLAPDATSRQVDVVDPP